MGAPLWDRHRGSIKRVRELALRVEIRRARYIDGPADHPVVRIIRESIERDAEAAFGIAGNVMAICRRSEGGAR